MSAVVTIVTSAVWWVIEELPAQGVKEFEGNNGKLWKSAISALYSSLTAFVGIGFGTFGEAKTRPGRLCALFFGFTILMVISAYTANLAAFLTYEASPTPPITQAEQLVALKKTACIPQGFANRRWLSEHYPGIRLQETPVSQLFNYIRDGKCAAALAPRTDLDGELAADCQRIADTASTRRLTTLAVVHGDIKIHNARILSVSGGFIASALSINARCMMLTIDAWLIHLYETDYIPDLYDAEFRGCVAKRCCGVHPVTRHFVIFPYFCGSRLALQ